MSSLFNLVNVPSAIWIDESGRVVRIDEGAYAEKHQMGNFEFGRDDYVPMLRDWVQKGADSVYVSNNNLPDLRQTSDQLLAEPNFRLGNHFHRSGLPEKADHYWEKAQRLDPSSWNYHRQDWSFTPEEAGENWTRKFGELQGRPYYRPIKGLDPAP